MAETPFAITVQAALDSSKLSAAALGEDDHLITATEKTSFSLSDDALKRGFNALLGQTPDDVFFSDPTPWNNLFATYGWTPVTTALVAGTPTSVSVTPGSEASFTLTTFTNSGPVPATFHAAATVQVETTLSDTWSNSDTIDVTQTVSYGMKVLGLGGETSFSYSHTWGQSQTQSTATTLGVEAGVEVTLQPGQSAYVVITATPGTLTMTVPYTATLYGGGAANYSDKCQGHHFWWGEINSMLGKLSLPTSVAISQTVTFSFYAKVSVTVHDADSHEVLHRVHLHNSPVLLPGVQGAAVPLPALEPA